MSTEPIPTAASAGPLVPMSFPGARRLARWLFWVILPGLSLGALALAISSIAQHLGDRPEGIHGSYLASRSCSAHVCLVGGTFVSDDGRTVVTSLLGDPRWATGSRHRVVYDGNGAQVIGVSQWDPTPSALAGIAAASYLGIVGYLAFTARRS
jgi:hypothetical protein